MNMNDISVSHCDEGKRIRIGIHDDIFIENEGETRGCGRINGDGHLYYIDTERKEALRLPDKYKDTPIILWHPCGGYGDGLLMVSLLGEIQLQYHHNFYDTAGLWGWLDLNGNEVIAPQYIYAMHFYKGRAVVCKGDWEIDENRKYWCDHEAWGIIDRKGNEIVPCQFDELYNIDRTDRFILCHSGGWENGHQLIYDIDDQSILTELDFDFDSGYMFNNCFCDGDFIIFDEHIPGEGKDYLYAYSISERKWVAHHELIEGRELNGKTRQTVKVDGKEIILF